MRGHSEPHSRNWYYHSDDVYVVCILIFQQAAEQHRIESQTPLRTSRPIHPVMYLITCAL